MWKVSYSNQREIQTALYLSQDVLFRSADVLMSSIYGGANLRIPKIVEMDSKGSGMITIRVSTAGIPLYFYSNLSAHGALQPGLTIISNVIISSFIQLV